MLYLIAKREFIKNTLTLRFIIGFLLIAKSFMITLKNILSPKIMISLILAACILEVCRLYMGMSSLDAQKTPCCGTQRERSL